jgi:hypothetical protein
VATDASSTARGIPAGLEAFKAAHQVLIDERAFPSKS